MMRSGLWVKVLATGVGLWTIWGGIVEGQYEIDWYSVDGGGGSSSGGGYVVRGTAGQADGGRAASCGYQVAGGYWSEPACVVDLADFAGFSGQWLESGAVAANLDGQGAVDILDLQIFGSSWLCYCEGDWPW